MIDSCLLTFKFCIVPKSLFFLLSDFLWARFIAIKTDIVENQNDPWVICNICPRIKTVQNEQHGVHSLD